MQHKQIPKHTNRRICFDYSQGPWKTIYHCPLGLFCCPVLVKLPQELIGKKVTINFIRDMISLINQKKLIIFLQSILLIIDHLEWSIHQHDGVEQKVIGVKFALWFTNNITNQVYNCHQHRSATLAWCRKITFYITWS